MGNKDLVLLSEKNKQLEKEKVTLSAQNKRLENDNEALRKQLKKEKNREFVNELANKLYILPSQITLVEDILSWVENFDESGIVTLSEGEAGLTSKIKTLLKSKQIVNLSMQTKSEEIAYTLNEEDKERQIAKQDSEALDKKIMHYVKKHNISYREAFLAVIKQ